MPASAPYFRTEAASSGRSRSPVWLLVTGRKSGLRGIAAMSGEHQIIFDSLCVKRIGQVAL